jgi:hypothetical protein
MPRFVDQLECGTRGQEKTSQASDHVFIPMLEVATHDWSSREPGMRTLQRGEENGPDNDRRAPNRNTYKILPAPVVSFNYTLLLRFATGTLNVRHCKKKP